MTRPVYSVAFYSGPVGSPATELFTVEAGFTYVVRTVLANYYLDPGLISQPLTGITISSSSGPPLLQVPQGLAWSGGMYLVETRLVLPPEAIISGFSPDLGWEVTISGYQLTAA